MRADVLGRCPEHVALAPQAGARGGRRAIRPGAFPVRHNRALPTTIVRGDPGEHALDSTFRAGLDWPVESKRALVARGYEQAANALRARDPLSRIPH